MCFYIIMNYRDFNRGINYVRFRFFYRKISINIEKRTGEFMLWTKENHDKKCTLLFKTKCGIKRSRTQVSLKEQTNFTTEQGVETSEDEGNNIKENNTNE